MKLSFPSCLLGAVVLAAAGFALRPAPAADAPSLPSDLLLANPPVAAHRFDDFVYTAAERRAETGEKLTRIRKWMAGKKVDALMIATERNMNWLTAGGKDHVVWAQRESPVRLLIAADRLYLIADNIEGPRVMTEELDGLGYEWVRYNWYGKDADALKPLLRGKKVLYDHVPTAVSSGADPNTAVVDFQEFYYPITAGELRKYRWLGKKTAEVLEQVGKVVRPGMTEKDIQYLLARELWYWDIFPTVILSAVDERFLNYRHPVVQGAPLKRYCALNVCGRRWGLVVSATRMLYFGQPTPALAKAWQDGSKVNAAMWAETKPGNSLGDVVGAAQKAYGDIGFPEEWKLHHQGGMTLGLERLYLVQPGDKTKIIPGMVLAWNPTVQGAKFEDTVVVKEDGSLENLTPCLTWPTISVTAGKTTYRVPGLLVRPAPAAE